eukprot:2497363-Pyramimonas_sp.AAC.1
MLGESAHLVCGERERREVGGVARAAVHAVVEVRAQRHQELDGLLLLRLRRQHQRGGRVAVD